MTVATTMAKGAVLDEHGAASELRIVVTGDRGWDAYQVVFDGISEAAYHLLKTLTVVPPVRVVVVHGGATGADSFASIAAKALDFDVEVHPADWAHHGKAAGALRNVEMLEAGAHIVVAFHDYLPGSKGTAHCVSTARTMGIPVWLFNRQGDLHVVK